MRKTIGLSHYLRVSGGMVDTLVLGASAERHGGSSPLSRTNTKAPVFRGFCIGLCIREDAEPRQRALRAGGRGVRTRAGIYSEHAGTEKYLALPVGKPSALVLSHAPN